MSGATALRGAMLAALRTDGALAALVNQVSDGLPVTASPPWLLVGDPVATGWGARGIEGVALRLPLLVTVRGDGSGQIAQILDAVAAALAALDGELVDGWRITDLRCERSRIVRGRTEWRASADYAVRAARLA